MKRCPYCEKEIASEASFCEYCNKPLLANLEKKVTPVNLAQNYPSSLRSEIYDNKEEGISQNLKSSNEYNKRIEELDKEIQQRQQSGDSVGEQLLEKAGLYYQNHDLEGALNILKLTLEQFSTNQDYQHLAIVYNELGLIYEDLHLFDNAINNLLHSIELFEKLLDFKKLIQVYNNLGNIYFKIEDLERSFEIYQKALDYAKNEQLGDEQAKTINNLIDVLIEFRKYEQVKDYLNSNLLYFKQKEDVYGIILTLTKYGILYYTLGGNNYEKAYQSLNEALDLIKKLSNATPQNLISQLQWECFLYLGRIHLLWNEDKQAEEFLKGSLEAVRDFELSADSLKEGKILEGLAKLYEIQGNTEQAISSYNSACSIYEKYGRDYKIACIKLAIAQLYFNILEDYNRSIIFLEEALELYSSLGYNKERAEIYNTLANVYLARNISERAMEYFSQARTIYLELQDLVSANLIKEKMNSLKNG